MGPHQLSSNRCLRVIDLGGFHYHPSSKSASLLQGTRHIVRSVFCANASYQAMEAHEKLRAGMEQSLARIPKELNKIRTLSNVYIQRDALHRRADEVLVSIFTVLERIIEKLSRTWRGQS